MALAAGVMSITVEFAKGIKDLDWFARQDPYCVLRVGNQTFRTNIARDGGRNPVWNETFDAEILNENDVELELRDDKVFDNPEIGHAAFSLVRAREYGSDQVEVPVVSRRTGHQHGVVGISLRWAPNQQPYGGYGQPVYGQQPMGYGAYGQPPMMPPAAASPYYAPQQDFGYNPQQQQQQQQPVVEVVEEDRPYHHHHHHHRPYAEEVIVEERRW